ncbi:MAG: hypothetical protein ACWA49_15430 [Ruegeria sp.]
MVDGYDKSLHAPLRYKTMESPSRDLDEARVEAAIADIMAANETESRSQPEVARVERPEFPELYADEPEDPSRLQGVASILRQKWAEFSGAA